MARRTSTRQYLLTLVAAVALVGSGLGVAALAQTDAGDVFTGCLNENSGALRSVAVGFEPAKACNSQELPITWDRAGPAFEARIAALEERIAELEAPFGTLDLFVDCAAGETIGAALTEAETHVGPLNITISGVCEETVFLGRDDVALQGTLRSDGIRAPLTAGAVVGLFDSHRVTFSNMTISGGNSGMFVRGSSFNAFDITIRDSGDRGIVALDGSIGVIRDCTILGHPRHGASAETESILDIGSCEITDNGEIGLFAGGVGSATIWVGDSYIASNGTGVAVNTGGNVRIQGSTIEYNSHAGVGAFGGEVVVSGEGTDTRIAENGDGIRLGNGASGHIDNAVIESNNGQGISLHNGADFAVNFTIVRNNGGHGIEVADLSTISMGEGDTTQIIDNGGWGIHCAENAAISLLPGESIFEPSEIVFGGNTEGDTNCFGG